MSVDASTGRSLTAPGTSRGSQGLPTSTRRTEVTLRAAAWLTALLIMIAAGVLAASSSTTAPVRRVTPSIDRSTSGTSWAQVPLLAQLAISRALGADNHAYWATSTGPVLATKNISQQLSARYSATGVAVSNPAGGVDLSLLGISGVPATTVKPTARANRITYARGAVSEWYANGPMGIEQGFNVAYPVGAPNDNTLTLALSLGGSLRARMQAGGRGVLLSTPGGKVALRYGQLSASDSTGRSLPVSLALHGHSLQISVRIAGARYPLSIDPIVQEGQLSGPSEGIGSSVAIEGSTIVVGAAGEIVSGGAKRDGQAEPQGAVFVFKEPAGGWASSTQAAELVASDADESEYSGNEGGDGLGSAVAISGKTIVASAPSATAGGRIYAGKVYVFEEPAGGWVNSYQNAELAASDAVEYGHLGDSVATDGQTVVAGEPNALSLYLGETGPGELYVFSRPGSRWTSSELQNARLTTDDNEGAALGWSVAFAGTTIVGGAPFTKVAGHEFQGALYLYDEPPAGGWKDATQSVELTAPTGAVHETLGTAVAGSGTTIAVGAGNLENPGATPGAAYIFEEPKTGWEDTTPPLARLTPSDPVAAEHFGGSIGISGSTVVVGAEFAPIEKSSSYGAAYVFDEPAGGWASSSQPSAKLYSSEGGNQQAGAVGVSGSTTISNAPYATAVGKDYQGAVYVFGNGESAKEETKKDETKEPAKEPSKEITFVTPTASTTIHYTSTAPLVERETFIGFPLNVKPGEPIACIGNVCTYAAIKCKKAKEPCIGSASYEEIAGAVASSAGVKSKKKPKKKPVVYGKGSFSIPAGSVGKITIKLTAAGRKLLKGKKHARGRLTITTSQPGGKTTTNSSIVTIKLTTKR
jgi:trimeric autotransporter adhesin